MPRAPSSHITPLLDCLLLFCQWFEQNWRQVRAVFSSPRRISRLDKAVSKFFVADSLFIPLTRTRQDKTILSCPCRWCKLGILQLTIELHVRYAINLKLNVGDYKIAFSIIFASLNTTVESGRTGFSTVYGQLKLFPF